MLRGALLLGLLVPVLAGCGGGSGTPASRPAPVARPAGGPATGSARPPRRFGRPGRDAIPMLMYHVIAAPPAGTPYPGLWTAPRAFAAQMAALHRAGFHGVTLDDVVDHWRRGLVLPAHPVVVSFDDGYASQRRAAGPVLGRLGWPGVLNLEVHDLHVAGGLSAADVRALLRQGWELASHTLTHPDLTTLGPAALAHELRGSRRVLRARFGVPVRDFCYPAGRFDAAVEAAVRAAGYRAATTEVPGVARPGDDPYALPRIRVAGDTAPSAVVAAARATSGRPS